MKIEDFVLIFIGVAMTGCSPPRMKIKDVVLIFTSALMNLRFTTTDENCRVSECWNVGMLARWNVGKAYEPANVLTCQPANLST